MTTSSNYDKFPYVPIGSSSAKCQVGWPAIAGAIQESIHGNRSVVCIECYPGVLKDQIRALADLLHPTSVICAEALFKSPVSIDKMVEQFLGDDPVFGRMNDIQIEDYFDPAKLAAAQAGLQRGNAGLNLVIGSGATLVAPGADVLIFADMARWEIQMRYRRNEIGNLGADNAPASASEKYKRAYFVDWRAA